VALKRVDWIFIIVYYTTPLGHWIAFGDVLLEAQHRQFGSLTVSLPPHIIIGLLRPPIHFDRLTMIKKTG